MVKAAGKKNLHEQNEMIKSTGKNRVMMGQPSRMFCLEQNKTVIAVLLRYTTCASDIKQVDINFQKKRYYKKSK